MRGILRNVKLRTPSDTYSLNVFSFIILLLADIFVFYLITYGLSQQVGQLTSGDEYFPNKYRQIYISKEWVKNNFIGMLSGQVLGELRRTDEADDSHKILHPVCRATEDLFVRLRNNERITGLFEQRNRLRIQYRTYDLHQKGTQPHADELLDRINGLDSLLRQETLVRETIDYVFANQKKNFTAELKRYDKVHAVKRTGVGFLFLLPLILLLGWWNTRANTAGRNLSIIFSSHLMIVSLIPVGIELVRLVLEVIPKVILKTLYDALMRLNLVSLWYYTLIIISIVAVMVLIWALQTKVFTQKRYLVRKIQKSLCPRCGMKVDYANGHCPNCANELLTACPACGGKTVKGLDFCQYCGNMLADG